MCGICISRYQRPGRTIAYSTARNTNRKMVLYALMYSDSPNPPEGGLKIFSRRPGTLRTILSSRNKSFQAFQGVSACSIITEKYGLRQ